MPKPHPVRDKFLKYLRGSYAHDMAWIDISGVYTSEEVRRATREVSKSDPVLHRILDYWIRTRLPRMRIADAVHYDSSTVKRKLDEAVDLILQNLKAADFKPNVMTAAELRAAGYIEVDRETSDELLQLAADREVEEFVDASSSERV